LVQMILMCGATNLVKRSTSQWYENTVQKKESESRLNSLVKDISVFKVQMVYDTVSQNSTHVNADISSFSMVP
jgi:hypothetical protein